MVLRPLLVLFGLLLVPVASANWGTYIYSQTPQEGTDVCVAAYVHPDHVWQPVTYPCWELPQPPATDDPPSGVADTPNDPFHVAALPLPTVNLAALLMGREWVAGVELPLGHFCAFVYSDDVLASRAGHGAQCDGGGCQALRELLAVECDVLGDVLPVDLVGDATPAGRPFPAIVTLP